MGPSFNLIAHIVRARSCLFFRPHVHKRTNDGYKVVKVLRMSLDDDLIQWKICIHMCDLCASPVFCRKPPLFGCRASENPQDNLFLVVFNLLFIYRERAEREEVRNKVYGGSVSFSPSPTSHWIVTFFLPSFFLSLLHSFLHTDGAHIFYARAFSGEVNILWFEEQFRRRKEVQVSRSLFRLLSCVVAFVHIPTVSMPLKSTEEYAGNLK